MSQPEPSTSVAKEVKFNENDQINEIAASVDAPNQEDQERSPDIFKLNINCFEDLFEYLSLQDVIAIGQTCKRLNLVAAYIIQQLYAGGSL